MTTVSKRKMKMRWKILMLAGNKIKTNDDNHHEGREIKLNL